MRYLGIDYGSKKTGLALSDESGKMGFPHEVVPTHELPQRLAAVIPEHGITAVVMGESKDFSGNENPIHKEAQAFAAWVAHTFSLPVHWEPEFLTSAAARRGPGAPDEKPSRSPKTHEPVDASAAALILTSYLSRHHE